MLLFECPLQKGVDFTLFVIFDDVHKRSLPTLSWKLFYKGFCVRIHLGRSIIIIIQMPSHLNVHEEGD